VARLPSHATLCFLAYGFLALERSRGTATSLAEPDEAASPLPIGTRSRRQPLDATALARLAAATPALPEPTRAPTAVVSQSQLTMVLVPNTVG
jgi:hypothetical protein